MKDTRHSINGSMKMIFQTIANSLSGFSIHISTEETNGSVTEKFRLSKLLLDREALSQCFSRIPARDTLQLGIRFTGSDSTLDVNSGSGTGFDNFCKRYLLEANDTDNEATLSISIVKSYDHKTVTVYSLNAIELYWREGGIGSTVVKLAELSKNVYIIQSLGIDQTFTCGSFVFQPLTLDPPKATNPESPSKQKYLLARDKCCLLYESKSYPFIPSDFHFDKQLPHLGIQSLFESLKLAFSVIFIADISSFEGASLKATIKGYRHITGVIDLSFDSKTLADNYLEIFMWAYTDGSVTDKLGIVRNLLSIHIDGSDFRQIRQGSMAALTSNYSIYLKENVKQYIEIKNKLSDQIQKQSDKASDVVKSIGSYLRASIFTVYSFVITTFVVRSISKSTTELTFTAGVYAIFLMFLALSLCTLLYAIRESVAEQDRFRLTYDSFKKRFDDLLSETDRARILQNDEDFNRDIAYIEKSRCRALIMWIVSLLVVFVFVTAVKALDW